MENNYSSYVTHNYIKENNSQLLNSHFVHYDKPLYVILGSAIYEMYGMIIANTYRYDEKKGDIIKTYRIPLTGPDLEPWEPRNMDDNLFVLPQNKELHPAEFRSYINNMEERTSVDEALDELKRHHFMPVIPENEVIIQVDANKKYTDVKCKWFHSNIEMAEKGWIHPKDILPVFLMVDFLDKPVQFVPNETDNTDNVHLIKELKRLYTAYKDGLFIRYGKIINDGTYTYSPDLGRIEMSHAQFMEKFPNAYIMLC